MANELRVQSSITLRKGNVNYQSANNAFIADVVTPIPKSQVPGALTCTTGGTTVDLSELTALGGICRITNVDPTNFVEYGIWDGATFYPLGELLPGEFYVFRLSRNLLTGESGTASVNSLRIRADTAACVVIVEAFDP
jgi:hypothetical protein